MIGNLCLEGCGCKVKIGFDESTWSMIAGCGDIDPITNLKLNISPISECKVVFCGNPGNTCGNAVRFLGGDWAAVKTYIENGGRVWMNAEYNGCLADPTFLADFLAAIGSTISWVGGSFDGSCAMDGTRDCTPGTANIAQGLASPFRMAATGVLSGGTNVFLAPSGQQMVQVEQLGDGFFFLCGDSNVAGSGGVCDYSDNCTFFRRLWEYADGDII